MPAVWSKHEDELQRGKDAKSIRRRFDECLYNQERKSAEAEAEKKRELEEAEDEESTEPVDWASIRRTLEADADARFHLFWQCTALSRKPPPTPDELGGGDQAIRLLPAYLAEAIGHERRVKEGQRMFDEYRSMKASDSVISVDQVDDLIDRLWRGRAAYSSDMATRRHVNFDPTRRGYAPHMEEIYKIMLEIERRPLFRPDEKTAILIEELRPPLRSVYRHERRAAAHFRKELAHLRPLAFALSSPSSLSYLNRYLGTALALAGKTAKAWLLRAYFAFLRRRARLQYGP